MGYFTLGLAAAVYYGDPESQIIALNGAILQMFNHGIITGGFFFLVGVLYERTHTRDGLAGFISELLVFRGAYATMPAIAIVGIIAIVLTAAYILWKIIQYVFLGEFSPEKWSKIFDVKHWSFGEDMAPFELITMAPLVFGMVLIGVYPSVILRMINHASQIILGSAY